MAYNLQKKYIQRANYISQEEEKYQEHKQKKNKGPKQQGNNEAPVQPRFEEADQEINNEEDDLQVNKKAFKKEKKSFKEKMKCIYKIRKKYRIFFKLAAKESFMSIFKKKKKTKNVIQLNDPNV